MKRTSQLLALVMVLVMILPIGVNATSRKTIGLMQFRHYTEEEKTSADYKYPEYPQIQISDITKEIKIYRHSKAEVPGDARGVYEAEVGTEIRLIQDNNWSFQVDKINLRSIEEEDFDVIKTMPITGQVWVREYENINKDGVTYLKLLTDKVVDSKEVGDHVMIQMDTDEEMVIRPAQGTKVVINEPGDYFISHRMDDASPIDLGPNDLKFFLKVVEKSSDVKEVEKAKDEILKGEVLAKPSISKVMVDGKEIGFEAYNIDNNNYFKLRDIAKVVSGTEKQFEVGWDNENKVINLISFEKYTENGSELAKADIMETKAVVNNSEIFKDGKKIELKSYTIKGNNYFMLRDLAQTFDIGITWNQETKAIGIDTKISYQ